jgi:Mce-associated membrane protein
MSGVSWYDLLGVSPDARPDQIKAAWREATDKFEPGSGTGQFRLFNEAADVLLDPSKRAAYDAELGAQGGPVVVLEPTAEPVPAVVLDTGTETERDEVAPPPPAAVTSRATSEGAAASSFRSGSPVPLWLMAVLTVLLVLALGVGGVFWYQHRNHQHKQDAGQEASAAAERALPVILSYDYRHLTADRDQAARFLSGKYKKEYTTTFNKLIESTGSTPGPAEQTKAVVKATISDIGVVDAEPDVAKVIVFLNQATVKAGGTPKYSLNRLTVSMVKSGNSWLVDNINSY